jgi:DNA-binding transcriptional regulator YiaG
MKSKNGLKDSRVLVELRALCVRRKAKTEPAYIREARIRCQLTQKESALLMATSTRSWQQWESGSRVMKGRDWELFCLLTQSHEARAALLTLKIRRA